MHEMGFCYTISKRRCRTNIILKIWKWKQSAAELNTMAWRLGTHHGVCKCSTYTGIVRGYTQCIPRENAKYLLLTCAAEHFSNVKHWRNLAERMASKNSWVALNFLREREKLSESVRVADYLCFCDVIKKKF